MLNAKQIDTYSAELFEALRARHTVDPLTERTPDITIDEAYQISLGILARREAAGGFCYINNAAVAAQVLRERFSRVLILDTDMHHGQGIQEIFWARSDVPYISIHGDPTNFYPVVAGHADEHGEGDGAGFNLNLPMPHGASEAEFFQRLDRACDAARQMAPQALVLCLGFDIYKDDPQSLVAVTQDGFAELGRRVAALGLPTLVVQEGGYHLPTLQ